MRKSSLFGRLCLAAAGLLCASASAVGAPGDVVISQVWGGPSSSTGNANYIRADYVELFNRTDNPVSLGGWSLNIATSSGTTWTKLDLVATIPARSYFLVRVSADANVGLNPPAFDAEFSPLSFTVLSTSGKVCLRDTTTAIGSTSCPTTNIIDLVTYGSSGTCFEGIARAPAVTTTGAGTAVFRRGDGCADTNDNANDFVTRTPAPRNSLTAALASCEIGACCDNTTTGICLMDTAAACAAMSGFSFTSVGTTCVPHPCTPTGACCTGANLTTCNVRTEAACTTASGRWTAGGACVPSDTCSNLTSCCLPSGTCCAMVALLCVDQGGTPGAYEAGCSAAGNCNPVPVNDLCTNAQSLTLGLPIVANNWAATTTGDGPQTPCMNGLSATTRGVWFTFVPPANGIYEFDSCGTQFNSDITLFSIPNCADPNSWTVVGCNDQGCTGSSAGPFCGTSVIATVAARLSGVPLNGGQTYHVRLSLNGTTASGNYRLVVNSQTAAATGACCFALNGRCEIRTQASCAETILPAGTFQGEGTTCSPAPCSGVYGACCSSGICQIRLATGCTAGGAFWLEGAACEPSPCNLTPNPSNGTCATAAVLSDAQLPYSAIVGMNQAPDGPPIGCSTATVTRNAVWYVYTPSADGVVSAWETGSRDVSVVAYDAGTLSPTCNSWTEIFCESTEGDANFPVTAGHTYYILFTTPGTASSNANDFYNIQIKFVVPNIPTNTSCATPLPLSSSASMQSFPGGGAPVGPRSQCQTLSTQFEARNAIWFTYSTGPNDEMVRLQRANNQTFFSLQFYTDGCTLTPWRCADLGTSNGFVQLRRNTTYTIMAHKRSGYLAGDGSYQFIFDTSTTVTQVPNQECATAEVITPPFFASVDNTMAFDEPSSLVVDCPSSNTLFNPDPAGAAGVWYAYTPTVPCVVKVEQTDTGCISPSPAPCTRRVDAVVAAFEGSCGGPRVFCSKTDTESSGSNLFRAYPPNTYYILVAMESNGIPNGSTYPLQVSITAEETLIPGNDDCATATSITTLPYSDPAPVPIGGAHDDLPRAICSTGFASSFSRNGVWYTYHNGPTAAGVLLSETGPLDTIVAAYSGSCGDLVREICVDDPESNMYLTLRPDTSYYFMVARKADFPAAATDTVSFTIEPSSSIIDPPANDACDHAEVVTSMPFSYTGGAVAAANFFNGPTCATNTAQATDPLWYAIDSGTGFTLHMFELASSPSVVWTIFSSCDQQFEQFCDINEGTATVPRTFTLQPGFRYYLRVSRESNSDYTLGAAPYNLNLTAAPGSNGACCNGGPCTITVIENCPSGFVPGGTCSPDPCAPTTQSCCRGTTCNSVPASSCTGVVAGSNSLVVTACGAGNTLAGCCFADFNHDGIQSIDDLFLYFNAYFTASPWANVGGDGVATPTIDDLFLYINAYFSTCS